MTLNNCKLVENYMQAALCILEIERIEYFKIIFLNIYNCVYKTFLQIQLQFMLEWTMYECFAALNEETVFCSWDC